MSSDVASGSRELEVEVTHQERSLQPGEAVLFTVRSSLPLESVEGVVFNRKVFFYPDPGPTLWRGLAGIDLETKPGTYSLNLRARSEGEPLHAVKLDLKVEQKKFPTREVKVQEKFVNPPKEMLERIKRESRLTFSLFETVTPHKLWDGPFSSPVPGAPVSGFGTRSIFNGQPRSPHGGVDLHAAEGTPIKAPNSGKVVLASNLYFSGNTVIIDHGLGLYSYFAHLSRIAVVQGDAVSRGDLVGYVGATGRASGPHLHWTVELNHARVDPFSLVSILSD
ncbi:MAG TPA: M23 family metallopeptidase [Acidobacteriota bacterium]